MPPRAAAAAKRGPPRASRTQKRAALALLTLASAALALASVELALRLQPFIVTVHDDLPPGRRSELLHHHQGQGDLDGPVHAYGRCAGARPLRVLMLGDSWVEVGDFPDAVGRALGRERCVEVVNAGVTSYSPSLYALKARALAAVRVPDLVLVNVDDTDWGDEWYRYRFCAVRRDGRLVAVRPEIDAWALARGLLRTGGSRWALSRFLWNLGLAARHPDLRRFLSVYGEPWHIMSFHLSERPREDFPAERAYFRARVDEMIAELVRLTGSPGRVVVTHHPHYPAEARGPGELRYNRELSAVLREASDAAGVTDVDAAGRMEEIHGPDWPRVFRWPEDPWSHLTPKGYEDYGRFVAARLAARARGLRARP